MGAFTRNIRNLWRLSKREVLCQLDVCKPDTISRFVNLRNSLWNSSFIQNTDDACSLHLTDVLRVCCYAKWAASRLWTINKLFASWESLHLIIMLAVVRGNSWLSSALSFVTVRFSYKIPRFSISTDANVKNKLLA